MPKKRRDFIAATRERVVAMRADVEGVYTADGHVAGKGKPQPPWKTKAYGKLCDEPAPELTAQAAGGVQLATGGGGMGEGATRLTGGAVEDAVAVDRSWRRLFACCC